MVTLFAFTPFLNDLFFGRAFKAAQLTGAYTEEDWKKSKGMEWSYNLSADSVKFASFIKEEQSYCIVLTDSGAYCFNSEGLLWKNSNFSQPEEAASKLYGWDFTGFELRTNGVILKTGEYTCLVSIENGTKTTQTAFPFEPTGLVDDVDSDGFFEIVGINPSTEYVYLLSGKDLSVIWSCPVSYFATAFSVPDADGDDLNDIVIATGDSITLVSSKDGSTISTESLPAPSDKWVVLKTQAGFKLIGFHFAKGNSSAFLFEWSFYSGPSFVKDVWEDEKIYWAKSCGAVPDSNYFIAIRERDEGNSLCVFEEAEDGFALKEETWVGPSWFKFVSDQEVLTLSDSEQILKIGVPDISVSTLLKGIRGFDSFGILPGQNRLLLWYKKEGKIECWHY